MNNVPVVLLLVVSLTGCRQGAMQSDVAVDEAAIRDVIAQTAAANNAADTLGWVELFEESGVYMAPGMPEVMTRAGLENVAAAGFGPYMADIQITPAKIVLAGDWAFARSHVTGTVTSREDGDVVFRAGPDTTAHRTVT